jgi:hypothetical protein
MGIIAALTETCVLKMCLHIIQSINYIQQVYLDY